MEVGVSIEPDKQTLIAISESIVRRLRAREHLGDLAVRMGTVKPERTDTGGWKTVIGDLSHPALRFEVWCDRFRGRRNRKLWFGVAADEKRTLQSAHRILARRFGQPVDIGERQITFDRRRGYYRIRTKNHNNTYPIHVGTIGISEDTQTSKQESLKTKVKAGPAILPWMAANRRVST